MNIKNVKLFPIIACFLALCSNAIYGAEAIDESLKYANNKIKQYNNLKGFLTKVESIKVGKEGEQGEFDAIKSFTNLKIMDLSENVLNNSKIEIISSMTSLTELNLDNCKKTKTKKLNGKDLTSLSSLINLKLLKHKDIKIEEAESQTIKAANNDLKFSNKGV